MVRDVLLRKKKIVKVDLRGDEVAQFLEIKEHIGLAHDSEILRYLIKHFAPAKPVEVPAQ